MSRRARHSLPGAIYHVMMRGNNGQSIFSSDCDRRRFCLLMQEGVERYGHRILAFCFMSNHVHLAIQVGNISLSKICQNLSFRYTRFYNRRHKTIGHLFQGRFKSIMVDGNSYLRKLVRYIHLNPVRARIVSDPLHYPWSSHQAYLMQNEFTWLARDEGLQFFGESRHKALERYQSFVLAGIGLDEGIDFKKGMVAGFIGDDLFIESVREAYDIDSIVRGIADESFVISLNTLLEVVADWYKIDVAAFFALGNDRRASRIRAVTAYLARSMGGVSLKEVGDACGRAANSMSQAATSLEAQMLTSERLKKEVGNLKDKLILATQGQSDDRRNQNYEA